MGVSSPIAADCLTTFRASKDSGHRGLAEVRLIVMHDTEGGTAKSVARYFASDKAEGSAHLVVDEDACYRCLPNNVVSWSAPGANTTGFHIEQVGFARWSAPVWINHLKTLNRAAYKAAFHCLLFGIPPVWITATGLRRGGEGVTSHAEVTKAFGGTHTDPGPLWPRTFFMGRVRSYYDAAVNAGL
jgi:hypothetical protein